MGGEVEEGLFEGGHWGNNTRGSRDCDVGDRLEGVEVSLGRRGQLAFAGTEFDRECF